MLSYSASFALFITLRTPTRIKCLLAFVTDTQVDYLHETSSLPSTHDELLDEKFLHNDGNFKTAKCRPSPDPRMEKSVSGERQCCGDYPGAFPYRDQLGDRKCCGQRTYFAATLDCCNDELVSMGTLCLT